jgi:hypothetical protein
MLDYGRSRVEESHSWDLGFAPSLVQLVNLRSGGALRWKVEDHRLKRMESVMWQAGTYKVVAFLNLFLNIKINYFLRKFNVQIE